MCWWLLQRSRAMRKRQIFRLLAATTAACNLALYMGARLTQRYLQVTFLDTLCWASLTLAILILSVTVAEFLLSNRIYKGVKYFVNYWYIKNLLERQMIDAGFSLQRSYYVELPKVSLSFEKGFSTGTLRIRNTLKNDKRLDDVVMSSGLGKYVVDRHYCTDDGNYYVYELVNGTAIFKLQFDSFDDFLTYSNRIPAYRLFLDGRSVVKLQHRAEFKPQAQTRKELNAWNVRHFEELKGTDIYSSL